MACAASLVLATTAAAALPDIRQAPAPTWDNPSCTFAAPCAFSMVKVGSSVQLQFPAEIDITKNGGALTITGSRHDTSVNTMDAFEAGVSGVVGALQYNFDPSHQHWHYLALDRYDLRMHDSSLAEVARDQKTGFCLVQSAQINPTDCQHNNPSATSVSETINPGFSDIYDPARDGQYIDVTGLNGTYEFIQWVNADCRLADQGPANHSWATVLNINATANPPTVSVASSTPLWNSYYASLPNAQKCLPPESSRPLVSGSAQVGAIVSTAPGTWLNRMANEFSYQWRRCDATGWACADIPGATAANYVPTDADLGHTLRARVTGTFIGDTEQGTPQDSEATGLVADATTTGPGTGGGGGGGTGGGGGGGGNVGPSQIPSLTAALKSVHTVSVGSLVRNGVRVRAHCSEACRVSLQLTGRGGVKLGRMTSKISKAGSRTLTLRLTPKAQKIVKNFRAGTLTLWLYVKSSDGQQQTVHKVMHLKV
ncbi:MAG: lysyl oxidase family protein [Thermoleophilaceae bacterium]